MGRHGKEYKEGEKILCPLYMSFTDREIKCRPHVIDASSIVIKYASVRTCRQQRELYCEGRWERCEHYLAWKHFAWEDEEE